MADVEYCLVVAEVAVNGKVLEWARDLRGLSLEAAADLLGVPIADLKAYESGRKRPLVGFLRLMAQRYRINFTSLLMPEPLPSERRPTDHRTRRGERPLTMDTLLAIEEVEEALEAFEEIAAEEARIVPSLNIGQAKLSENPVTVAERERRKFSISLDEQYGWRNLAEARRSWRQRIEDRGVFTYMIAMPPDELSGFSLMRNGLAAICVNDREPTEGAKIFTFLHEYCHLLLRKTGISDENPRNRIERFCNQFAASVLIPAEGLRHQIGNITTPHEFTDADVRRLANAFRVSHAAVAMRLEEAGLAPQGFYRRRTAPWEMPKPSEPKTYSDSQPSAIILRLKRLGRLHAATVLRANKRKVINSFDASELIGLQPASFQRLEARIR